MGRKIQDLSKQDLSKTQWKFHNILEIIRNKCKMQESYFMESTVS